MTNHLQVQQAFMLAMQLAWANNQCILIRPSSEIPKDGAASNHFFHAEV